MTYVGFSTTDKLVSRIIRWITKAQVSHTFLIVELYGQLWAVGAEFNGMVMTPLRKLKTKTTIKYICRLSELTDDKLAKLMDRLGESYDFGGLLGGIFPQIGRWFKQKWKNPWNNKKALFCSEFVTLALQEAGLEGAEKLDPGTATPQELKDFLTEYNLNRHQE